MIRPPSVSPGQYRTRLAKPALSPTATWSALNVEFGETSPLLSPLSPAERMVAVHLRCGLSNREIARTLGKSELTVKSQVSAILAKCGVPTRARLIAALADESP